MAEKHISIIDTWSIDLPTYIYLNIEVTYLLRFFTLFETSCFIQACPNSMQPLILESKAILHLL